MEKLIKNCDIMTSFSKCLKLKGIIDNVDIIYQISMKSKIASEHLGSAE